MKDYKPRAKAPRRKSRGGTLVGIFIGLALGLLIAVGVAFYVTKMPPPFPSRGQPAKPAAADRDLAAKAPGSATQKPQFDFYRILPGQEVPVSDKELKQQAQEQAKQPNAPKENYLIQAGAFQSPADADSLKARLALLGLEASVEPAHLPDKGTLYRVRLGPYQQLDEINRVRATLSQNGVDASLVRVKN